MPYIASRQQASKISKKGADTNGNGSNARTEKDMCILEICSIDRVYNYYDFIIQMKGVNTDDTKTD